VAIRPLTREEIDLIWTIDRSEVHHNVYKVVDGRLALVPAYFEIPGWHPETVEHDMPRLHDCFDRGGIFIGNFDADGLTGISVLDTRHIGAARDHLQLLYLYVSRPARGRGLGSELFAEAASAARRLGARALYISAVPTENTVNFYLRRGATLAVEPDPELLAAEPDDVHLTYPL
jgi:GNAT superfamily N-acetyltransferase